MGRWRSHSMLARRKSTGRGGTVARLAAWGLVRAHASWGAAVARKTLWSLAVALLLAARAFSGAGESGQRLPDLTELSLEELMNIRVTSVSRKTERLSRAAGAIHVITQDDLRRAGVTSLPEALRLAPGMEVARVDAHTWGITSRGFNDVFANKLLVMIDGRSMYTPLFSGVFWDMQDTLLEDLERIEIIRGPGAALWGANAVNGVINIITRRAKDTQGVLLAGGGGTEERGFGNVRYGGTLGGDAHFRVYAKYFNRDESALPSGAEADDAWQVARSGFRMDWDASERNTLTLAGDLSTGTLAQSFLLATLTPPFQQTAHDDLNIRGGNLLARWSHTFSDASDIRLQFYYDHTVRDTLIFKENRDNYDVDFQLGRRQDIIWGLGYRLTSDDVGNSFSVALNPQSRTTRLLSAFAQDEITLLPNQLYLTLGSKFEQNDFTGFEIQPRARLSWTPSDWQTIWAAISRAVRTPSRAEDDIRLSQQVLPPGRVFPGAPPAVTVFFGNRGFDSEKMLAYELGYRVQPHEQVTLDLATFYNAYDHLRSLEPGTPFLETSPAPAHLVIPFSVANKLKGETYGVELSGLWQVAEWWRLRGLYSFLQIQLRKDQSSQDTISEGAEGNSPHHQFSLRSSMDLPGRLELDLAFRYVDRLPSLRIPSYSTLDVRVGWKITRGLEAAIVAQNLLDHRHPEFRPSFIGTQFTEIQRAVYTKLTWRF